jgi:hypothetical protein
MKNMMMLIHSTWNKGKTIKLIPTQIDCPYNEAIYDPDQKVLAVISKECKETYQMLPKFNEKGDVMYLKGARENGKSYAEERRLVDTYYEYYLENKADILLFIEMFAGDDAKIKADAFMSIVVPQIENPIMYEGVKSL